MAEAQKKKKAPDVSLQQKVESMQPPQETEFKKEREQEGPPRPAEIARGDAKEGDIILDERTGKQYKVAKGGELEEKKKEKKEKKEEKEKSEGEWATKSVPTDKEKELQRQGAEPTVEDLLEAMQEEYSKVSTSELDALVAATERFLEAMKDCDNPDKIMWQKHRAYTIMEDAYFKLQDLIPGAIRSGLITGYVASNIQDTMSREMKKRKDYA